MWWGEGEGGRGGGGGVEKLRDGYIQQVMLRRVEIKEFGEEYTW
jgi:hypothetical protein